MKIRNKSDTDSSKMPYTKDQINILQYGVKYRNDINCFFFYSSLPPSLESKHRESVNSIFHDKIIIKMIDKPINCS